MRLFNDHQIRTGLQVTGLAAALVGLWEVLSRMEVLNPVLFPPPSRIFSTLLSLSAEGRIWNHVWTTLQEMLLATLLVAVAGGLIGVALGLSELWFKVTYGPIATLFAFPKVTLFPVFITAFGLGLESKVLFGALVGIFPVLMGTMVAVRGIRSIHRALLRSVGASFLFSLRRLYIPATLPGFVASLRIGFVYCGIGVLLAEMFAAYAGLGNRVVGSGGQATMDQYWVYVVLASALIVLGASLCRVLELALGRGKEDAHA